MIATGGSPTGAALHDLNGDGSSDLITVEGGRLVARTLAGGVIWDTPSLQARSVISMEDVDADGLMELVVDATTSVVFLDAATGVQRWASMAELPIENLGGVILADVDADPALELFFADRAMNGSKPHLTGTVFRFDFEQGFAGSAPTLETAADTRDYEAGVNLALADVDADGVFEIVVAGWRHVYLYDVVTGALKGASEDLTPVLGDENLALGAWFVADMGGDPGMEIALYTDNVFVGTPSRRLLVWTWSGGELALRWTRSAVDPETDVHRWPSVQPARLVGDSFQLVSSLWSPASGWETALLNPWTGAEEAVLQGEVALAALDLDGASTHTLISVATTLRDPDPYATSRFTQWGAEGEAELVASFAGRVFTRSEEAVEEIFLLRDDDQDGWGDALAMHSWPGGAPLGLEVAGNRIDDVLPVDVAGEPGVMTLHATGEVGLYDKTLALRNDIDGDGHGDLVFEGHGVSRVAAWDGSPPLLAFPQSGGRITVVDASTGDPTQSPVPLLSLGGNIAQHPVFLEGPEGPRVPVFFLDAQRQLCVRFVSMDGSEGPVTVLGGAGGVYSIVGDLLVWDATGDGVDDLALIVRDLGQSEVHRLLGVDGNGGALWPPVDLPTPGGNVGSLAQSADGESILIVANKTLWSVDVSTGEATELFISPSGHWYGIPVAVDLDEDGNLDTVFFGTSKGVTAFSADWFPLWVHEPGNSTRASGAWVKTPQGVVLAASQQSSAQLDLLDGASGSLLASRWLVNGQVSDSPPPAGTLSPPIQEVIAMDPLDSSGAAGFVVTSASGHVYALGTGGEARWSLALNGALGAPVVFDADGDGLAELAVPTAAGHVVGVDRGQLAPPEWVRENAGEGPALSDADDIDMAENCATVSVNWAEVPDATGYVVTLVSEFGTLLASTWLSAETPEWTFQGLELPLNTHPHVEVSAIQITPTVVITGPAESSDGLLIADLSPPEVSSWEASLDVMTVGEDGDVNQLIGTAIDAKMIQDWEVEIRAESGEPVRTFSGWGGAPELALEIFWEGTDAAGEWVETGTYLAHVMVRDAAGATDADAVPILVCAAPFVRDVTKAACVDPSTRIERRDPDDGSEAESGEEGADETPRSSGPPSGGCGCRQSGADTGAAPDLWMCWIVLGGLAWRRRRGVRAR